MDETDVRKYLENLSDQEYKNLGKKFVEHIAKETEAGNHKLGIQFSYAIAEYLPKSELPPEVISLSVRIAIQFAQLAERVKQDALQRKKMATLGGRGRSKKWTPVRDYAVRLAKQGKYRSRRHAAASIEAAVLEFAKSQGLSMTSDEANRRITIESWLKAGLIEFSKSVK
ncbi:hypothetical protein PWG14_18640 (plasmid) [Chromobacterium amazonense]|uniref:hypothetical protein n=1 Tax=Chromobacterium amazonense TaxID=1382803 RepID=UPI00237EE62A|nr:hypothetical protein [Chromobacterium amazonense]MDE1714524.1 hypothetical protein [Chromobacterium amazonense]